ncbi:MAG: P-loop NTPase family protein [Acidiferrobacterales bacterium]
MGIEEATVFFAVKERIHKALRLAQGMGQGYLTWISPVRLSPGSDDEAQRIRLVTELAKNDSAVRLRSWFTPATDVRHTMYILDEPTVSLHMADLDMLIPVLHRLVLLGNAVRVIEHNLDMIAEAGWIMGLEPGGGDCGGRVVAQGTADAVVRRRHSDAVRTLAGFLCRCGFALRCRARGN